MKKNKIEGDRTKLRNRSIIRFWYGEGSGNPRINLPADAKGQM